MCRGAQPTASVTAPGCSVNSLVWRQMLAVVYCITEHGYLPMTAANELAPL